MLSIYFSVLCSSLEIDRASILESLKQGQHMSAVFGLELIFIELDTEAGHSLSNP